MMGKMNEGCGDVGQCEYPFDRPFGGYDEQLMTFVCTNREMASCRDVERCTVK